MAKTIDDYIKGREWWKPECPEFLEQQMRLLMSKGFTEKEAVDFVSSIVGTIRSEYGD